VLEGSKLSSRDIMEQRAKTYGTTVDKLLDFYQQRNMLKVQITSGEGSTPQLTYLIERLIHEHVSDATNL
jgi:hypothetical protein